MASGMRVSGSWRNLVTPHGRVSGTWRQGVRLWSRAGGVWRKVWEAIAINLTNHTIADFGFTVRTYSASVSFRNTGQLRGTTAGVGSTDYPNEWQNPVGGAAASDYEVRAVEFSQMGAATRNGTMNTWLNLGTDRVWTLSAVNPTQGVRSWVIDFEIRDVATQTVQDTCRIDLSFEYAP